MNFLILSFILDLKNFIFFINLTFNFEKNNKRADVKDS
jgi:hypothetical protein